MSKKTITTRVAAVGLAAAAMVSGFTGCDKDKKNTEPSKENKESIVTTVDMPSKTEPVVITTEPATTEIATTEPTVTEVATTEPVVETTEAAVDYIDLNNVRLIAVSLDTGNYYYTMKLDKSDTNDTTLYHIIHICDDYEYYYYDVTDLDDEPYITVNEYYTGIGLSEGCSGFEYTTYDMNDNKVGICSNYENPDKSSHMVYIFYTKWGERRGEAYTGNQLLDYKSVSAAEVFGVDELPRKKFIEFLKTLEEINFDTIVDQWAAFQS